CLQVREDHGRHLREVILVAVALPPFQEPPPQLGRPPRLFRRCFPPPPLRLADRFLQERRLRPLRLLDLPRQLRRPRQQRPLPLARAPSRALQELLHPLLQPPRIRPGRLRQLLDLQPSPLRQPIEPGPGLAPLRPGPGGQPGIPPVRLNLRLGGHRRIPPR